MSQTFTIPVVTRTQDNGDGGYTTYVYNDNDELIKDHPKSRRIQKIEGAYKVVYTPLSNEMIDDILNENDPYENGYIGKSSITIVIADDGTVKLAKSCRFHAGQ